MGRDSEGLRMLAHCKVFMGSRAAPANIQASAGRAPGTRCSRRQSTAVHLNGLASLIAGQSARKETAAPAISSA
jgi:hypothetical protein